MRPASTQLVIFGLTGDLARKKLLPSLYALLAADLLPRSTQIIGVSRRALDSTQLLDFMRDDATYDPATVDRLAGIIRMFQMDLTQAADYPRLKTFLNAIATEDQCPNRLIYLSMPPQVFGPVIDFLGRSGLNLGCNHGHEKTRLLIEKPFGFDLASAEELSKSIAKWFDEDQIYRIDHYLAKDGVRNLLTFRQSHPSLKDTWNCEHIERIVITSSETIGIEGRADFYDQTGALRDVIQNHQLQLLSLIAMELPTEFNAEAIHAAKTDLLQAISAPRRDSISRVTSRGQYKSYIDEIGHHSDIETFAAIKLFIDNPRWQGVAIILQTGKAMSAKRTDIVVEFKDRQTKRLIINIEPDEEIKFDAYQRLFDDAIVSDRTLFVTDDEILASWRIIDPILTEWSKSTDGLISYSSGVDINELNKSLIEA